MRIPTACAELHKQERQAHRSPHANCVLQKIIEQLKTRGIGVIITDHNVRETLSICDHAYIIKDGRIIREGAPQEIAEDPQVREIYLGENFRLA